MQACSSSLQYFHARVRAIVGIEGSQLWREETLWTGAMQGSLMMQLLEDDNNWGIVNLWL